jgi:SAM-dependent methyltransferase
MRQADIFLDCEGNNWYARNKDRLGGRDIVSFLIEATSIVPTNVIEVGCANGWRLAKLREKYNCKVLGIEPSEAACIDAIQTLKVPVLQSTADTLPAVDQTFDLIIYGFCLYMTDPDEWFRIAYEADRVLQDGGYIVIHDFEPFSPYARPYEHRKELLAYHVNFSKLWLGHPLYHLHSRHVGTDEDLGTVTILKKSPASAIKVRA